MTDSSDVGSDTEYDWESLVVELPSGRMSFQNDQGFDDNRRCLVAISFTSLCLCSVRGVNLVSRFICGVPMCIE